MSKLKLIQSIAKTLGIPSIAVSVVCVVYLVGTYPIYDDLPIAQYWHKHFVDELRKPTPMDMALNDKIDIQEIVQGYEYRLDKQIDSLDDIKKKFGDNPTELMIELERWKAEKQKIENKLQDWRNKSSHNRSEIKLMLASSSTELSE